MISNWREHFPTDGELDTDLAGLFRVTPDAAEPTTIYVFGLTRVSSPMQAEEGNSLSDQQERICTFAEAKGWTLLGVFEDPAFTGRNTKRPGLRALIKAIKAGRVKIVIIDRLDRLSRDLYALLKLMKLFQQYGVQLISLRENIDFSSHWGRLVLYVLGALAEFYVAALAEEIRLSRKLKSQRGLLSGSFRLGFCKGDCSTCTDPNGPDYCPSFGRPDVGDGKIRVHHPVEALAVRLMFEWYATGRYSDHDVAQRLNREVFALDDGPEVRFRTKGRPGVCDPQPFDADAVRAILNNPIYCGYVPYYSTHDYGARQGKKRRKPVEVYAGQHQPIVDLALFKRVQTIRKNRYRRTTSLQNPARVYPLTGVLFCDARKSPLRGLSSNGGTSRYYVDGLCRGRLPREQWHQKNLRADDIEQRVQDLVTPMTLPADWKQRILAYLVYDDGTDEIEREKFALRQRLERALELYTLGEYDRARLERIKAECRRDLAELAPESTSVGGEAQALLEDLPALWTALSDEELKTLYGIIFDAIYVRDEHITAIHLRGPFRGLLEEATGRLVAG